MHWKDPNSGPNSLTIARESLLLWTFFYSSVARMWRKCDIKCDITLRNSLKSSGIVSFLDRNSLSISYFIWSHSGSQSGSGVRQGQVRILTHTCATLKKALHKMSPFILLFKMGIMGVCTSQSWNVDWRRWCTWDPSTVPAGLCSVLDKCKLLLDLEFLYLHC